MVFKFFSLIIIAYFSFPHSSALLADILHFRLLLQSGSEKQSKDESPPVLIHMSNIKRESGSRRKFALLQI